MVNVVLGSRMPNVLARGRLTSGIKMINGKTA